MVLIMIPLFFFNGPQYFEREPRPTNGAASVPFQAHTWSSSWQIFLTALLPFLLTTLTLGDFEDILTFLPIMILSILTTRNSISDFLARMHPSLMLMLVLAIPSLYQLFYYKYSFDSSQRNSYQNQNLQNQNSRPRAFSRENENEGSTIVSTDFDILEKVILFMSILSVLGISLLVTPASTLLHSIPSFIVNGLFGVFDLLGIKISEVPVGSVPASSKALAEIKKTSYKVTEHDLLSERAPSVTCTVCLSELKLKDIAIKLGCYHIFHTECLLPWLSKHCTCPTCRYEVETDNSLYEIQRKRRQGDNRKTYFAAEITKDHFTDPVPGESKKRDIMELSVSELKKIAAQNKINIDNIFEKAEVIETLRPYY